MEKVKVGDYFFHKNSREVYIIGEVDCNIVCAICLENGNRFVEPIKVYDAFDISLKELNRILNNEIFYKLDKDIIQRVLNETVYVKFDNKKDNFNG